MPRRLYVVDGADKGQSFLLPESGKVLIGNSRKNTDFCIHDLLAARVHCEVQVAPDSVAVAEVANTHTTLVNGVKVTQQALMPGDVIRAGNSYLRLEEVSAEDAAAAQKPAPKAEPPKEKGEAPTLPPEKLAELSGYNLGHYKLGSAFAGGHGGMAFRAHDTDKDQPVVLKVLSPEFPKCNDEMQNFVRAMKQRMSLHHPGLVALRGVGKTGAYAWIATEPIEGESLTATLERLCMVRKVPWKPVFRMAVALVKVLDHLQKHHAIHANITPANVLMPSEGPPRLNDFGLWQALEGSTLQQKAWPRKCKAELPYLSPEHLDPETPLDDLSDQYCLGAVLYAFLTGRPPFEGNSTNETAAMVRDAVPIRPKELKINVPDDFQGIVLRMLAKHPEDRYSSPRMILADLEEVAAKHRDGD